MIQDLSTEQLRWLNDEAVRKHANRVLVDGFWSAVDPDGVHVVSLVLPYGQNTSGPCYRVMILCKMLPGQGTITHENLPMDHVVIDVDYTTLDGLRPSKPLFDF